MPKKHKQLLMLSTSARLCAIRNAAKWGVLTPENGAKQHDSLLLSTALSQYLLPVQGH